MAPVEEITQVMKKVGETLLQTTVKKLFNALGCEIICNARKVADLKRYSSGGSRMTYHELDVWIPSLNIGFEYQVIYFISYFGP